MWLHKQLSPTFYHKTQEHMEMSRVKYKLEFIFVLLLCVEEVKQFSSITTGDLDNQYEFIWMLKAIQCSNMLNTYVFHNTPYNVHYVKNYMYDINY